VLGRRLSFVLGAALTAWGMPCASAAERPASPASAEVTVFAAASLTNAFGEIAAVFEAQHPDRRVVVNFAGSQRLAAQILEAAPADVFASADSEQMERIRGAGLLRGRPRTFATNRLVIAVESGNPEKITSLADLSRPGLVVVLAAQEVPAGRYAREVLRKAGVALAPASLETDVRSVVSKVRLGEADAGIVYRSDIVAAGKAVTMIEIPAEQNVTASYPIAVLERDTEAAAAEAFVDLVLSEPGRRILVRFGFGTP